MAIALEICAGSLQSAIVAQRAGASRIELCSQLEVGGLTPSWGLIKATAALNVPVHVLIRPRTGGFVYSDTELSIIEADIAAAGQLGCAGVAIGVLTRKNRIDVVVLDRLVQLARRWRMSVTFHRAFDDLQDMEEGLETVIALGCDRILTSGGRASTEDPLARQKLRALVSQARGRVIIMPGAGITPPNVASLVTETAAAEVHSSCKRVVGTSEQEESIFHADRWETDEKTVVDMRKALCDV